MGTIELLKNMQEKCLNGGKYDDPLRMEKYQALEKAIKAIENQGKHEKVDGKTNDLKNCPFCGGKVKITKAGDDEYSLRWFITRGIGSDICTCRVFMASEEFYDEEGGEQEKEELINRWNARKGVE